MPPSKIYAAVFSGGNSGFYENWNDCNNAVKGKPDVLFRGFRSKLEAKAWVDQNLSRIVSTPKIDTNIAIYVDGAFTPDCDKAGWGWVAVKEKTIVAGDYGVTQWKAESRNIDGEIEAAIQAIRWAHSHGRTCQLFHDYAGLAQWANGNWRAKSRIANYYLNEITSICRDVTFQKVTGHSGDKWNDYVDELANKAIREYLSSLKTNA